jgi:hypothetical protein
MLLSTLSHINFPLICTYYSDATLNISEQPPKISQKPILIFFDFAKLTTTYYTNHYVRVSSTSCETGFLRQRICQK